MKILNITLISLLLFLGLSCKKTANNDLTAAEIASDQDASLAFTLLSVEGLSNEMEFIARQLTLNPTANNFLSCGNITSQNITDGKRFEIDFNLTSACSDNSFRAGKLIVTYQTATGNILITPENYVIAEYKVTGSYLFQPVVEQQKELLKLTITNGQLTNADDDYVKFNVEHKTNFKEGQGTPQTSADDVLETVSATYRLEIKNQAGSVNSIYEASSASPYILKYSCTEKFRPRSGKMKFQRTAGIDRYILFGTGNCSDLAKVSPTP